MVVFLINVFGVPYYYDGYINRWVRNYGRY